MVFILHGKQYLKKKKPATNNFTSAFSFVTLLTTASLLGKTTQNQRGKLLNIIKKNPHDTYVLAWHIQVDLMAVDFVSIYTKIKSNLLT
jgi:hypothetical protein